VLVNGCKLKNQCWNCIILCCIKFVDGGPTEEVISKETRENYFGCDSGKDHPTCGMQYYGLSEPVPFSEVST